MEPTGPLKTWGKNRSVRLPGFDYREHAPYHVIICAREGSRPFSTVPLAAATCNILEEMAASLNFYLAAYCLMPDHLHILLSPAGSKLSLCEVIGRFKGKTTNNSWKFGWQGQLWQDRFYDHIVRKDESITETAKYILDNPMRASLGESYPYRWADPEILR